MSNNQNQMLFRIPPFYYIHVLDMNTNITTLVVGPQTYLKQDNQKVIIQPTKMVTIPPRHYCVIQNPVIKDQNNNVVYEPTGDAKLAFADLEIRFSGEPFPLYPGEIIKTESTPLQVVPANRALHLKAILDYETRTTGDEWLFEGPGTYTPRKEVEVIKEVTAIIIKPNQGLRLKAKRDCVDRNGITRVTGEEWIIKKQGGYLPNAYEEVVKIEDAFVLTDKKALHLKALNTFIDENNIKRLNGEEWLVKLTDAETYIQNVYEQIVGVIDLITLTKRQYCVILNPVDDQNKPQIGHKKLVKGEKSFFLQPGETLESGVQDVYVLCDNEGLVLKSLETFTDETNTKRIAGDQWLINGPMDYIPPVEVQVVSKRVAIPLNKDEGVYVRNTKTGEIRTIIGQTYMLNENEDLWEKESTGEFESHKRDKTRVVKYCVPNNHVIKVYNYDNKRSRIVFGPESVLLEAKEEILKVTPITVVLDILFFFVYIFYMIYAKMVSLTRMGR